MDGSDSTGSSHPGGPSGSSARRGRCLTRRAPRSALAQAEQLGGDWIPILGPDRAEDTSPPVAGLCYYTPLLAMGGNLTVGHGAALSRVADPSDLRATRVGSPGSDGPRRSRIQFRWRWTPEAASTRMVIRQGSPPTGPDDPEAVVENVAREEYDRAGAWTMNLPHSELDEPSDFELEPSADAGAVPLPSTRWHATAFSVVDTEDGPLLSPGLDPTATIEIPGPHPEVTLSYALKRPWLPGRPWSLVVKTEPPGEAIPPLVLVANSRAIPLSADDGDVVAAGPRRRTGPSSRSGRASISPARACVHSSTRPPSRARCPRSASAIPNPAWPVSERAPRGPSRPAPPTSVAEGRRRRGRTDTRAVDVRNDESVDLRKIDGGLAPFVSSSGRFW